MLPTVKMKHTDVMTCCSKEKSFRITSRMFVSPLGFPQDQFIRLLHQISRGKHFISFQDFLLAKTHLKEQACKKN